MNKLLAAILASFVLVTAPVYADENAVVIDALSGYMDFAEYGSSLIWPEQIPADDWKKVFIIDARDAAQFAKEHIPGAINIEWRQAVARRAELPKDRMVVMYCNSGSLSAQAVFALRLLGYDNVKVLQDGFEGWKAKGGFESHARASKPAGHQSSAMGLADYDAWYDTPRGRWVGDTEYAMAARLLAPQPGDSLLDVGCGTGWFTRRFAAMGLTTSGLDANSGCLAYARSHSDPAIRWVEGDAHALHFPDASFDHVLSIAALCFVADEQKAVAEIVRVARRRFAISWLNRGSLLYWQKGKHGGSGAYRGARWHSAGEVRALFSDLVVRDLSVHSAIFLPGGTPWARLLEKRLPDTLPWGGLLMVEGIKA